MRITSCAALVAVLALLAGAPVADAAKTSKRAKVRTLTGQVASSPYVVGSKVVVPLLLKDRSAKRAGLRAPVGILMLKKSKKVGAPKRKRVAPEMLRAGDRFRARAKVTKRVRRASYWRMSARKFRVTKRSRTLSPAEILALVNALGSDLNGFETALTNLAKYVQAGFNKQGSDIAGLQKGLTDLTAALAALEKRVAAMESGLPGLEKRLQDQITALSAQLAAFKTQVDGLTAQLATLQTSLTNLQNQVGTLSPDDLQAVQDQVTAIQGQLGSMNTALDALCGASPLC